MIVIHVDEWKSVGVSEHIDLQQNLNKNLENALSFVIISKNIDSVNVSTASATPFSNLPPDTFASFGVHVLRL